jgi:hypothetical protein
VNDNEHLAISRTSSYLNVRASKSVSRRRLYGLLIPLEKALEILIYMFLTRNSFGVSVTWCKSVKCFARVAVPPDPLYYLVQYKHCQTHLLASSINEGLLLCCQTHEVRTR